MPGPRSRADLSASRAVQLLMTIMSLMVFTTDGMPNFLLPSSGMELSDSVIVGNASDVIVEIECNSSTVRNTWTRNGTNITEPLMVFGESQDPTTGILRIFDPSTVLSVSNPVQYTCTTADGEESSISLTLADSLFFISPLPASAPNFNTSECQVPDIPSAEIRFLGNEDLNFGNCIIDTERGSFSSRRIDTSKLPPVVPSFTIQPLNTSAIMMERAAFSCAVFPDITDSYMLINITWMFVSMGPFGSASGMGILDSAGTVDPVPVQELIRMVTIADDLPQPGVSVLVLDAVSDIDIGYYYCVAHYLLNNGSYSMFQSEPAFLAFSDFATSQLILTPPMAVTVNEGNNLSLPCVTLNGTTPSWTSPTMGVANEFTFDIVSVSRELNGTELTCQFNGDEASVSVIVLAPLVFTEVPDNETIVSVGGAIELTCVANGNPAPGPIAWYVNNTAINISTADRISQPSDTSILITNIQLADAGIYQCLYEQNTGLSIFSITALTYLNVYFLGDASVEPFEINVTLLEPDTPDNLTLDCVVPSHPVVPLTWTNLTSGEEIAVVQTATGFGAPSQSVLVVNTSLLAGMSQYRCSAELNGNTTSANSTIIAYSRVTLLEEPMDPDNPLLIETPVSFQCRASSVPAPRITWYRYEQGRPIVLMNGSDPRVTITEGVINGSVISNITIVLGNNGFTQYYCLANNTVFSNTSRNVTVIRGFEVELIVNPFEVRTAPERNVTFDCSAFGIPLALITWQTCLNSSLDGVFSPVVDGETFTITSHIFNVSVNSSRLTVNAVNESLNETEFRCIAENIFGEANSTALLLVAGPPLKPILLTPIPKARSVNVTWLQPFSLIHITHYNVDLFLNHDQDPLAREEVPGGTQLEVIFLPLTPRTQYSVTVSATNEAGISDKIGMDFYTLEDTPDGPPTNILSSATLLGEIFLSWEPPLQNLQNGIIRGYVIHYQANQSSPLQQETQESQYTLSGLRDGTQYSIQLQARTSIGPGNLSDPIYQSTIAAPPAISNTPLAQATDNPPTSSSIPVQIPSFPTTDVEQLWVVAIKLNSTLQSTILSSTPDTLYPNNNSFIFAAQVSPIPFGVPYIAAEITASAISLPFTFFLGDNSQTQSLNDFPNLYSNPSLSSGTNYTAFVRAFPPAVSGNSLAKRQTGGSSTARQYTVFTSTDFMAVVTTNTTTTVSPALSPGAIVGILFAVMLGIIIAGVIGLIIYVVCGRMRVKSLPPPNRRGSVRLSKNKIEINSSTSDNVFLVRSKRGNTELSDMRLPEDKEAIPISRFPEYVRSLHANSDHLFSEDFDQIGIQSPSNAHLGSSLPCNIPRNRYGNINCFDETRVFLLPLEGNPGSDYINANYLDGYNKKAMYIATQGPLPETTPDFWRMIWEQQSCCIVMLTNCVEKGRPKCHQYWPQTGSVSFGNLSITIVDTQVLAYYTIRTFRMNMGNDRREVKQFHYTAWPDFGVPDHPNPILSFIRRLNNFERSLPGPDVIHCSAGVGRTGTYITIQSMMNMIETEGRVDIFNFVLNMRNQRNFMVQTEQQYIFIHDAVVEVIRVGDTEMTVQNIRKELKYLQTVNSESELCPLREQFDKLNSLDIPNPAQFVSATQTVNKSKNRFGDIIPYEAYRVKLCMMPGVTGSDYINASYVDGYLRKNQFILTQGPLQSTVNDFWRLAWEQKASAIVMLCQVEEKGKEQSARYWPTEKMTQYGDLFVDTTDTKETEHFTVREFMLTHTKQNDVRSLKQFQYTDWPEDECPDSSSPMLSMISQVQRAHHQFGGGPVVVHDSSSIGRAGTFCVLNIVIERLKVEGMIDVFFTAHSLRRKHPGIVASYDQYVFCFNTIIEFLDSFDHYANFD